MITENLSTLRIHKLTQEQYNRAREAGQLEENAIYLTPDDASNPGGFATEEYVDEKIADLVLESAQADWNQEDESKPDFIHNKPEIPSIEGLATIEYVDSKFEEVDGGSFDQVQADWNVTDEDDPAFIKNKPDLSQVGGSSIYTDNEEPADAPEGSVWLDMDDDGSNLPMGGTLPPVSAEHNGMILQVVNGKWSFVTLADSEVKSYVDEYIVSALEGEY